MAAIVARGLADAGVRTELVTGRADAPAAQPLSGTVAHRTLVGTGNGGPRRPGPAAVFALASYLRRERPCVLLSPGNQTHVTAVLGHLLSGVGSRTRLAVKITNPVAKARHGALRRGYRRGLYGWIFSRASSILVLSEARKQEIAAAYPRSASKLRFVHNPYVTAAMRHAEHRPDGVAGEDGVPIIVAAGRLARQKNYPLLLRAVARLRAGRWRLVILGTGPEEAALRGLAEELGIADRVRFEGFVADPAPFFRHARLLALSSDWEDLPAVVLEALACGCPVVATACSESLAAVIAEADYGLLVPPGDEAGLATAIDTLLRDPPERRVPPVVAAYSVENGVADHLDAVRPLLRC